MIAAVNPDGPAGRRAFYLIFGLSGLSGLIYESIWTHYLKLFLGHAAHAQTIVLAIFMGGMAAGSWICSRRSTRWPNLLRGYALVEASVGVLALAFHGVFVAATEFTHDAVLPGIGSPAAAYAFKWALAALLILPQSVLLGMTFPLMSGGILRRFPLQPGRSLGLLYFANSLGAAIGVLLSGFALIRWLGLPGTMRAAGVTNLLLAAIVSWLAREPGLAEGKVAPAPAVPPPGSTDPQARWLGFLLAVSFVTGASSFVYEIGWIRMLSLVLGSSTHAFELMLCAFILGLAFGGLFIQRRIDGLPDPARYLAVVQVLMGMAALATLALYAGTFPLMRWMVVRIPATGAGYLWFNLLSNAIAAGIMLPATFCAGMTLPLITFLLLRSGEGERSIGAVYAWNTLGAIAGVFLAIHVGMPFLGLKGLVATGATLDIALGLAILWRMGIGAGGRRRALGWTAASAIALGGVVLLVNLDPASMSSGVYRRSQVVEGATTGVPFHRDGKTATVSVVEDDDGYLSVRTNGKIDALLGVRPGLLPSGDESTMVLLGVLPMALHPRARTAAVIGMGSGMTTHTLLGNPRLASVDTVEIEARMVEAARLFRPRVELAFTDPRSRIHVDDAKTFFSVSGRKYDLVVSEPSNPWVSGVSGLFSREFYREIRRHMSPGGLFVQWIQLYEITPELVASILKAIGEGFADYAVYAANDSDLIIVARADGSLGPVSEEILELPVLARALARVDIRGVQDLALRKVGDKGLLRSFVDSFPIAPNSDYDPVLDQNAARARFLGEWASALVDFTREPLPVSEMLGPGPPSGGPTVVTASVDLRRSRDAHLATLLRDALQEEGDGGGAASGLPPELARKVVRLRHGLAACRAGSIDLQPASELIEFLARTVPYLAPGELSPTWNRVEAPGCQGSFLPFERAWIGFLRSVGDRDAPAMAARARGILQAGPFPPPTTRQLVLGGMLGSIAAGDREAARRLWEERRAGIRPAEGDDLTARLLAAEASAR
jgi:spermidine synthase